MKKVSILLVAVVIILGITSIAHASLILCGTDTLGNQLIYDDDLNITWYDYTNGPTPWWGQDVWAKSLTVDFGGTVYDDWRLPTALNQDGSGPCFGYNCTGSEMGHLYYTELGNPLGGPLMSTSFTDGLTGVTESFLDLQPDWYWSGNGWYGTGYTGPELPNAAYAWIFAFWGYQTCDMYAEGRAYALAVRDGDVSAVPEPGTMLLLGSGLVGLVAFRKRLRRIHR